MFLEVRLYLLILEFSEMHEKIIEVLNNPMGGEPIMTGLVFLRSKVKTLLKDFDSS